MSTNMTTIKRNPIPGTEGTEVVDEATYQRDLDAMKERTKQDDAAQHDPTQDKPEKDDL